MNTEYVVLKRHYQDTLMANITICGPFASEKEAEAWLAKYWPWEKRLKNPYIFTISRILPVRKVRL